GSRGSIHTSELRRPPTETPAFFLGRSPAFFLRQYFPNFSAGLPTETPDTEAHLRAPTAAPCGALAVNAFLAPAATLRRHVPAGRRAPPSRRALPLLQLPYPQRTAQ
ncbi:unnamed protein product, partial [Urochloa humidicola]